MGKQRKKQCEAIIQDKKSPSVLGIKYLMPLEEGALHIHKAGIYVRVC